MGKAIGAVVLVSVLGASSTVLAQSTPVSAPQPATPHFTATSFSSALVVDSRARPRCRVGAGHVEAHR